MRKFKRKEKAKKEKIADDVLQSDEAGSTGTVPGTHRSGSRSCGKVFRPWLTTVFHLHPFGLPNGFTR